MRVMKINDIPLSLPGRLLFLCSNPALVTAQLQGQDLTLASAGALRDASLSWWPGAIRWRPRY